MGWLLTERQVNEAWEMYDYVKQCLIDQYGYGRARAVVLGTIEEQKTQADHHRLGKGCPTMNIDNLEVRNSSFVAIVDNKIGDKGFRKFGEEYYPRFGEEIGLPALVVNHYIPEGEPTKYYHRKITHMGLNLSREVGWVEYKRFMNNLKLFHDRPTQMKKWFEGYQSK